MGILKLVVSYLGTRGLHDSIRNSNVPQHF